jgi:hypothetical protein
MLTLTEPVKNEKDANFPKFPIEISVEQEITIVTAGQFPT